MPLPQPRLDDREFADLIQELTALIPGYNSAWTNFNPTDPGITLLELFAWLADQTLYRANRIPEKSYVNFLKIMDVQLDQGENIESGVHRARSILNERYRAITSADYEVLTLEKMDDIRDGLSGRAIVLSNLDLSYIPDDITEWSTLIKDGHISIIVIPRCTGEDNPYCDSSSTSGPSPSQELLQELEDFLKDRRIISTFVHLVPPVYLAIELEAVIALKSDAFPKKTGELAESRIAEYFDPVDGGPEGRGWPAGRSFHKSEFFQLLEGTEGVDHVESTRIFIDSAEVVNTNTVTIKPWELVYIKRILIQTVQV